MPVQIERQTLNERELSKLVALYKKAQRDIISTFDSATDFGQARRIEQLAQIDRILKELGVASNDYIDIVLGSSYKRGSKDALDGLNAIHVGIKDKSTMSVIDKRAVAALVSETQEAFAMSLTTVGRSANRALSNAVKAVITDQLATGRIEGQTLKQTSAAIKAAIKTDGITALVDKRGVEWTLERYADMLARTKMVEARNTGLANKMLANGYDLVQVSNHYSKHKACAAWEGRILSLTGKTKGYPTLEEAKANGLFHPNCKHRINVIQTDYAALTKAYDRESGRYVPSFQANLPAIDKRPTVALTPKPKPVELSPQNPLFGKSAVTLQAAGKKATYELTGIEQQLIDKAKLKLATSDGEVLKVNGRKDPYTRGFFRRATNELVMRSVDAKTDKHTFYHELGHALDFKLKEAGIDGIDGYLQAIPAMATAIRRDKNNVVALRIIEDTTERGKFTMDFDQAVLRARGLYGMMKDAKTGAEVGRYKSSPSWTKYARTPSEVLADAYGRYRLDPDAFKKLAPSMYQQFKELGL